MQCDLRGFTYCRTLKKIEIRMKRSMNNSSPRRKNTEQMF